MTRSRIGLGQTIALSGLVVVGLGVAAPDRYINVRTPEVPAYATYTSDPWLVGITPDDVRRHILPCAGENGGPVYPCVWDAHNRYNGTGDILVYDAPESVVIRFVFTP